MAHKQMFLAFNTKPDTEIAEYCPDSAANRPQTMLCSHARKVLRLARRSSTFDPNDFLTKVGSGRTIARYLKNQKIYSQGEAAGSVFYIQKGKVKVTIVSQVGKEAVIAILGKDEFCGEGCLAGQKIRIATATAMGDCEIMKIEKEALIRTLQAEPAFSELFLSHLLLRSIRVEEDLVDQLFNSSEKRLARALLLLANFGKEGKPEAIIAKVSQETLAEMIGTTRSRVSFFMNKFRKLGFISYNGRIEVHSSLLSVVLGDHPLVSDKAEQRAISKRNGRPT